MKTTIIMLVIILFAAPVFGAVPSAYDTTVRIHNSPHSFCLSLFASDVDKQELSFRLIDPPLHGAYTLKPGATLQQHVMGSANLIYIPQPGFIGQEIIRFRAQDPDGGDSNTATLILEVLSPVSTPWAPPIGIPKPEFGIEETHWMYVGQIYDYNGSPGPYKDAGHGPYTHYIDNTHPSATNTNNRYGTADRPRQSPPAWADVQPGAVIEIHGGTYVTGQVNFLTSGTFEKPVFIRGTTAQPGNNPTFQLQGGWIFRGHHIIAENLRFIGPNGNTRASVEIRPAAADPDWNAHHVAIRDCHVEGSLSAGMTMSNAVNDDFVHNIVYYNNEIHGDFVCDDLPRSAGDEQAGVRIEAYSNRVWIVDNNIHHFPEDCSGAGHGARHTAYFYFIGRNQMHETGANAVDIKEVEYAVISQNTMYHFHGENYDSGGGPQVVVHYGPTYAPKDVWMIFNDLWDGRQQAVACSVTSAGGYPFYMIGNRVSEIKNAGGTAWIYRVWNYDQTFLIDNTFHDVDNGFQSSLSSAGRPLTLHGNIVSTLSPNGIFLDIPNAAHQAESVITNNIFYQPGGTALIRWGSVAFTTLAQFQAATGKGQGCMETNPLFVNAAGNDFHIQNSSAAKDAGSEHPVYQLFQDIFGIPIRFDRTGMQRPQGSGWDIGAYEYAPIGPFIGVAAPINGAIWVQGTTHSITWSSSGVTEPLRIELYKNDFPVLTIVDAAALETGSYSWIIPENQASGDDYTIKLSAGVHSDRSDVFTVAAPARPEVQTNPAGSITHASVVLRGLVHPMGLDTTYHFEYGPTDAYGFTTADGNLTAGNETTAVQASITGLNASATHHFRLKATNSAGTTEGGDMIFTTSSSGGGSGNGGGESSGSGAGGGGCFLSAIQSFNPWLLLAGLICPGAVFGIRRKGCL